MQLSSQQIFLDRNGDETTNNEIQAIVYVEYIKEPTIIDFI